MAKVTRVFPYVNGRQTFTMPNGYDSKVTYHAWGGGGAGGGDSNSNLGGNGSAGTYITGQTILNPGDTVELFVGQGGQEGQTSESNKKLYSCTIEGTSSSGVGPTASYGWVNDPTKAIYPEYNGALTSKTFDRWNSFMNTYAVSDLPNNRGGTEEVTNHIYFPAAGQYQIQVAGDNIISWTFRGTTLTSTDNFANGPYERTISVPEAGIYELQYILTNYTSTSGNPAGAAIAITRGPASYMGGGGVQTYPGGVSTKNIIWSTRLGPNVDLTNRVPILYAPVVNFYQPQSGYNWGGIPDQGMAFISATSTWTDQELEKLNLSRDRVITIGYPVNIKCQGSVDQVIASGYYTFARGQTWELARYNWIGNPGSNTNTTGRGSGTPSNWTERQWWNDNKSGRSSNVLVANWDLPVPPDDKIYIVGYADGVIYNAPSQRGSNNLTWTVSSTISQTYNGGPGGKSAINVGNKDYNYYGGYGGQIGNGKTSGGGGGGGGATVLLKRTAGTNLLIGLAIAGGGSGGGGAGFKGDGQDGHNEYEAATAYPNSIGAGQNGQSAATSGGGGGGGGGGCDGGRQGLAAVDGLGSGGSGAFSGGSQTVPTVVDFPVASIVMIGRGGDGGNGGGGGGAGELVVSDSLKLRAQQFIQVGGSGESRLEGGPSAVWWSDTEYITAGPGGRGGQLDAAYGRNGNGQTGGALSGDRADAVWGGSGGGGGTNPNIASASGGPGVKSKNLPGGYNSYYNSGGGGNSGAGGGGGGASGGGSGGNSTAGGNGGAGRTVTLGNTGKNYVLGGGGGGGASKNNPGALFIGRGAAGGGDGNTGTGPGVEFTVAKQYTFYVPPNTTSINIEGIAGGGGGGSGATQGSGGGGSGGYLPSTSYAVQPGQRIDVTVGKGGNSGSNGENTVIRIYSAGDIEETIITLGGGKAGTNNPASQPAGGAGGSPNGNQGQTGSQPGPFAPYSGRGADSPYGRGGDNCQCDDTRSKPGNGNGYGSGGGGGGPSRNGGLGAQGYVRFLWTGGYSVNAEANTGSGGGGGFDGGSGQGGSGFVAIAYAGEPLLTAYIDGKVVPPLRQNGYTIHEFIKSGVLAYVTAGEGRIDRGSSIYPGGTNVTGYVSGTAVGGVGNNNTDVFPVTSSSYPSFLNEYGVWNSNPASSNFNRTYYVTFPETARYDFKAYADNGATVQLDGGIVLDLTPADRENGTYWYKNGLTTNKRITAGQHKLEISATNLTAQGAFALTIVKEGTSNPLIFNSRQPPVPSGSATGGNGLIILEFQGGENTSRIKVDNDWKRVINQYIKIDGAWKRINDGLVKVNGTWQSLFGAQPINVTIDQNDWGGPNNPGTPSSNPGVSTGGNGGGGGCKIICTALYEMGLMPKHIYQADELFGEMLRTNDPAAYYGYVKWASVVVDWMEGSGPQCMFWIKDPEERAKKQRDMAIRWAHRIATPWSEHMAFQMGVVDKDNRAGRLIMKTGLAISKFIGKVTKTKEPSKSVSLGYAMWATFALFYILAGVKGE